MDSCIIFIRTMRSIDNLYLVAAALKTVDFEKESKTTMLSQLSMNKLLKYASYGGMACVVIASLYQSQQNMKIKNAPYFKDSINLLEEHKAAETLLGKPINHGYIDIFTNKNRADSNTAEFHVPLMGTKSVGVLIFKAVRDEDEKWIVKRVELEMTDNLGGKVLIYDENSSN